MRPGVRPVSRGTVVTLAAMAAMGPLSIDLYLPATPGIASQLHTGQFATQLTVSGCIAGLALGQLVSGPVSDRYGRRRPLLVGMACYAVLSLACALAPNIASLIAFRLLQGLAGAAGIVISRSMVRDLYEGRAAARMYATLATISAAAPVLAPVLGAQLLRIVSWRGLFGVLAGVGGLLVLAALALPETLPSSTARPKNLRSMFAPFAALSRNRQFLAYCLALGLGSAALFTYISSSPFVIEDVYGRSTTFFSLVFAANSVGILAASQLSKRLVSRVHPDTLLRTGLVLQAAAGITLAAVALTGSPPLWALLVPLFLVVAMVGLIGPNATAMALEPHAAHAGAASAQLGTFQMLTGAVLSPLAGLGPSRSAIGMSVLIAVLSCSGLVLQRRLARSAHAMQTLAG